MLFEAALLSRHWIGIQSVVSWGRRGRRVKPSYGSSVHTPHSKLHFEKKNFSSDIREKINEGRRIRNQKATPRREFSNNRHIVFPESEKRF
jgi:hypothetical protein